MLARLLCCSALLILFTVVAAQTATDSSTIFINPTVGPTDPTKLHPVERVERAEYGLVGAFPLEEEDLEHLVYPSTTTEERQPLLEGLTFFTTPHKEPEGLGPLANQKFCLGCHTNSDDVLTRDVMLVHTISQISRAARSSTTNFSFTQFDPATGSAGFPGQGGGRAPNNVDAMGNTGKTAAFTLSGLFSLTHGFRVPRLSNNPPGCTNTGAGGTPLCREFSSGGVQRVRPSLDACLPDRIFQPADRPLFSNSFADDRRTTGERAAPPYIGRGLIEAVPEADILANVQAEQVPIITSINGEIPESCVGDCVAGRANMNTSNQAFVGGHTDTRVGRLGLRAAGPTLTQFMIGGSQGELGFTSPLFLTEPFSFTNQGRAGCVNSQPPGQLELPLSTIVSLRALIRFTAPPEFGRPLLNILNSDDPAELPETVREQMVHRGAELFGIDLVAFANRMIPERMPAGGDGRDDHAINLADRKLNCVGCHTPVMRTGELQFGSEFGAAHLNDVWVPLFSDLLIHKMTDIDGERNASTQRRPLVIQRVDFNGGLHKTLDLARGLADDTLPNQGLARGDEWRTPPLMGLGKIGPPFLHDARVFLSKESVATTPAGTVYSDADSANNPLVVQTLNDVIRAAIELHDLPAPFDAPNQSTQTGGGCPVPPGNSIDNVQEGPADICPPYGTPTSARNRSQAKKVIKRWRSLSDSDQRAVIEFLKQL